MDSSETLPTPIAIMCGVSGALAAFYHDSLDINDIEHRGINNSNSFISENAALAAMCYKYSIGQPFMFPLNKLSLYRKFFIYDVRNAL